VRHLRKKTCRHVLARLFCKHDDTLDDFCDTILSPSVLNIKEGLLYDSLSIGGWRFAKGTAARASWERLEVIGQNAILKHEQSTKSCDFVFIN